MAGEGQAKREEIDGRGGKRRGQHCSHTCSPGILIGMGTFVIGTIIISDPSPGDKLSGSYASPLHDQLLVSQLHTVEALDSL